MRILRFLGKGIGLSCVLAFVACTGVRDSGNPVILIPALDDNGNERFEYVSLQTMPSPFKAEGDAARIYFNPQLSGTSFSSPVAEPHLVRSGNVFVPTDTASGTVLATYAFYEKMMFYERRVLLDSIITWPRIVAVYRNVINLPKSEESNASFAGAPYNITSILPFTENGGISLSFNPGVLGHEHLHAHFEAFVLSQLSDVKNAKPDDAKISQGCPRTAVPYALKLLRSWNEGLADFYGAVTSRSPRFILKSLPGQIRRVLDAEPVRMKTKQEIGDSCFAKTKEEIVEAIKAQDEYFNGTQLGRALYAVAANDEFPYLGADAAQLTKWERAARYVMHRISQLKDALPTQDGWLNLEPDFALCFFLKDVTRPGVTTMALSKSRDVVQKAFTDSRGLSKCDAL